SGRDDVRYGLAADLDRRCQHVGLIREYVGAAGRFALVVHEPLNPCQRWIVADGLAGAGAERNRLCRIGRVFIECRARGCRRGEGCLEAWLQIERRRMNAASAGAARWPRRETLPCVGSGLERVDRCDAIRGCVVLEIVSEERSEDVLLEVERCVAVEFDGAKRAAVLDFLAVVPWSHDE